MVIRQFEIVYCLFLPKLCLVTIVSISLFYEMHRITTYAISIEAMTYKHP